MQRCSPQDSGIAVYQYHVSQVRQLRQAEPFREAAETMQMSGMPGHVDAVTRAHMHEEHEVGLVIDGFGEFQFAGHETIAVSSGHIIAIPGGVEHYLHVQKSITLWGINIHPHLLRLLRIPDASNPVLLRLSSWDEPLAPLLIDDQQLYITLHALHEETITEYARIDRWKQIAIQALGQLTVVALLRAMQDDVIIPTNATARRILYVKAWMDRHFVNDVNISDLAKMAYLSESHFSACFRQYIGLSPKAYLIQLRVQSAAQLLAQTELAVMEVSLRSGFDNLADFHRIFKKHMGVTPGDYRKKQYNYQRKVDDKFSITS